MRDDLHPSEALRERLRLVRRRHTAALNDIERMLVGDFQNVGEGQREICIAELRQTSSALEEVAKRMCEINDAVLGSDRALLNALER